MYATVVAHLHRMLFGATVSKRYRRFLSDCTDERRRRCNWSMHALRLLVVEHIKRSEVAIPQPLVLVVLYSPMG